MRAAILYLALALVTFVQADIYLHNPRGSNNRLDEANRERNNANRLFDSQNNNRGGYNVGSVYYYEGSTVSMEWTNQHSCGNQNNDCEQIVQYMCDDRLRDGSSTNTIPDNPVNCDNYDCNTDLEFGMHEDFDYYTNCKLRSRNMGLFLADRNLRGNTAEYTRQNNNGNRRGYECPEERDYYPYWHPTPWRDIVIFTTNVTRCPYYLAESENVKSRYACVLPTDYINQENRNRGNNYIIPITQEECEAIVHDDGTENGTTGIWQEFTPGASVGAPECVEAQWSRDNHLGNTVGGFPINYNWTVPNLPHEHCTIRIRYNITTTDYEAWEGVSAEQASVNTDVYNGNNDNLQRRRISPISSVYERFGFDTDTAKERGYVFRQNPVVKIFPDTASNNFGLQLAINTNQFGRTFQDRGHSFAIRSRSEELSSECATIHNLNVRGKRGNIVQVYPGVEYDFVPNRLVAAVGDCVHFQWTGSNTNPNNNDGQGRAGTDRSNVVLLHAQKYPEGMVKTDTFGHWGTNYPENLDTTNTSLLGLSRADRQALATLSTQQYGGEMSELDDAGTYFDLGPRKITMKGTYYYMCTRNNNFTNRGQKGKIIAQEDSLSLKRIGWPGGVVETPQTKLTVPLGTLSQAVEFRITDVASAEIAMADIQRLAGDDIQTNMPPNQGSGVKKLDPTGQFPQTSARMMATIAIDLDDSTATSAVILQANEDNFWVFEPLDTEIVDGRAVAQTAGGGYFVVATPLQYGLVVGIPIAIVVILLMAIIALLLVIYFRVRPEKWSSAKENVQKTQMKIKRSFAKQI